MAAYPLLPNFGRTERKRALMLVLSIGTLASLLAVRPGGRSVQRSAACYQRSDVLLTGTTQPNPAEFSARMSGDDLCAWAGGAGYSVEDCDALREGEYDGVSLCLRVLRAQRGGFLSCVSELRIAGVSADGATRLIDEVYELISLARAAALPALILEYKHMDYYSGEQEECTVELRTEDEFQNFAGPTVGGVGACLWLKGFDQEKGERTKRRLISFRAVSEAVAAMQKDESLYLWHQHPLDAK